MVEIDYVVLYNKEDYKGIRLKGGQYHNYYVTMQRRKEGMRWYANVTKGRGRNREALVSKVDIGVFSGFSKATKSIIKKLREKEREDEEEKRFGGRGELRPGIDLKTPAPIPNSNKE